MDKVAKAEKKLKYLIEQLEDRLAKTEKGSKEAFKIQRELKKLGNEDALHG